MDFVSFIGLIIVKIFIVLNLIGGFMICNVQLMVGELVVNFFFLLIFVVLIIVDNVNLINLISGMFFFNIVLQIINLFRNKFIKVFYNFFSGLKFLIFINMLYIDWDCICMDLGFQYFFFLNYINLYGNIQCMILISY